MSGFTLTAVYTGAICYVLGLCFGWLFNYLSTKEKIKNAYNDGVKAAELNFKSEKTAIGGELEERLLNMRNGLVSAFQAYEETVHTVDEKLSPGMAAQLTIGVPNLGKTIEIDFQSTNESDLKQESTSDVVSDHENAIENTSETFNASETLDEITFKENAFRNNVVPLITRKEVINKTDETKLEAI